MTQIQAVSHLVEMAEHLQRMKDVSFYNTTLTTLKKMYHHKYWNSSTNSYQGNTQTSNLMPLVLIITITLIQDSSFKSIQESKIPILIVDNDKGLISENIFQGLKNQNLFEVIIK